MLDKRDFYINGKWVAPAVARDLDVINPSTEDACAVISLGGTLDYFVQTVFNYPTLAEAYKIAALDAYNRMTF